jgi:hypothetical protein
MKRCAILVRVRLFRVDHTGRPQSRMPGLTKRLDIPAFLEVVDEQLGATDEGVTSSRP